MPPNAELGRIGILGSCELVRVGSSTPWRTHAPVRGGERFSSNISQKEAAVGTLKFTADCPMAVQSGLPNSYSFQQPVRVFTLLIFARTLSTF